MNKRGIHEFYASKTVEFSARIRELRHRSRMLVASELIFFIAAIGFVAAYTVAGSGAVMFGIAAVLLIAYGVTRQIDVRVCDKIEYLENTLRVYNNEISYLDGDYSKFDRGEKYIDPRHPFTYDMDIFGNLSLYNRLCRTVTTGGSDYLAKCLSMPLDLNEDGREETNAEKIDFINKRNEAIRRLADMEKLRAQFMSANAGIDTDAIKYMIGQTRGMKVPLWASSAIALGIAWLSIAVFIFLICMSAFSDMPAAIVILWGTFHLFAVALTCSRPLRNVRKAVSTLHKQMKSCVRLVKLIVSSDMYNIGDPAMKGMDSNKAAIEKSFSELNKILDGLDRSGSFLGQLVFNVFALTDFFILRRFAIWQRDNLDNIETWVDNLVTMDALVSMATFRYNEPDAVDAEFSDGPEVHYVAEGLYHPFIGEKAVRNCFTVVNSNYYVITGANMAGKSTFLRSVGINYILALSGMPVFADSLKTSIFNLFTSMRTSDDLGHGISYFNAELLRLDQLIESVKTAGRNTLIILDEILKGTNSLDKLNGSRMFLEAISRMPVSGIIATHDLELSKMADEYPDRFHNYCFEIRLSDEITYTYKITQGVARNQNATYLLRNILKKICQGR